MMKKYTPRCRQPFEAELDEGMAEGVMATSDGRLLEGFISNVFVVVCEPLCPAHTLWNSHSANVSCHVHLLPC